MALKNADDFLFLMQRYEKKLFYYVKRLANISDADAEDILQEVFIKAYENLNDFDKNLKFSSWIYRIAHNHTISHYRKNKKNFESLSEEDSEIIFKKISSELDIKKDLEQKFKSSKVRELLSQLDKKYRDVLILKFLEDKDYKEISNILKKPMGSIAALMNRAKNKFKKILIKNYITA
ncbi:sigma-70 family RNA polymerase sigma factor [Candidatus Peregrinibacteria bacterium]|nr:sigma-70 family RNA polymerase sigma factor [Candidatus Peregrinibacteria bacterium]